MSRPRPRPAAEASTFDDALKAIAPSPEQLETFETLVELLVLAFRHPEEIERVSIENASLFEENTRLKAENRREKVENTRLKAERDELRASVAREMDQVMALEQRGRVVPLPKSMTGAR